MSSISSKPSSLIHGLYLRSCIENVRRPGESRKLIAENPVIDESIQQEYIELFDRLAEKDFKGYVEMDLKTELHKASRE